MKLDILQRNLEQLIKQRNNSGFYAIIMAISNVILVSSLILIDDKVVIIPSELKQKVWLSDSRVSKEYLEEWAMFISSLILDVSADSAAFKRDVLLRHVSSKYNSELSKELILNQQKMLSEQYSTSFRPIEAEISEKDLAVIINGELITFVGSKNIKQERGSYSMKFDYKSGNLLLKSFKEVLK